MTDTASNQTPWNAPYILCLPVGAVITFKTGTDGVVAITCDVSAIESNDDADRVLEAVQTLRRIVGGDRRTTWEHRDH